MANKPTDERDKARLRTLQRKLTDRWIVQMAHGEVTSPLERSAFKDGVAAMFIETLDAGHEHGIRSRDGEVAELKDELQALIHFVKFIDSRHGTSYWYASDTQKAKAALSGKENNNED